jgi:hypothetical protein
MRSHEHHCGERRRTGRHPEPLEGAERPDRQEPVVAKYVVRAFGNEPPVARPEIVPGAEELTDHRIRRSPGGEYNVEDLNDMTEKRGCLH